MLMPLQRRRSSVTFSEMVEVVPEPVMSYECEEEKGDENEEDENECEQDGGGNGSVFLLKERSFSFENVSRDVIMQQAYLEMESTGGAVWDCAVVLGDFLDRYECRSIPGKVVVELGCGLGLVSIVSALLGGRVIATDGDDRLFPVLQQNIQAAFPIDHSRGGSISPPEIMRLRWGNETDMETIAHRISGVDLLVGSDVVFDTNSMPALAHTIRELAGPDTVVILAHMVRHPDEEEYFFDCLRDEFSVEQAPPSCLRPGISGVVVTRLVRHRATG